MSAISNTVMCLLPIKQILFASVASFKIIKTILFYNNLKIIDNLHLELNNC